MNLDDIKAAVRALTPEDFTNLETFVIGERTRRVADRQVADAITDMQEAGTMPAPAAATEQEVAETGAAPEWVDPGTDHAKMYTPNTVFVQHNGKIWRNNHPGLNCWEPGGVGVYSTVWEDVTAQFAKPDTSDTPDTQAAPSQPAPWVQPGSTNPYGRGDKVTYGGAVYESLIDGNVWSPDAYPAGWKKVS